MKKRLLIGLAAFVTACNLAVGAYAMRCEGVGGGRACGTQCVSDSAGNCGCAGTCTNSEMDWVAGAGKPTGPIAELEQVAY